MRNKTLTPLVLLSRLNQWFPFVVIAAVFWTTSFVLAQAPNLDFILKLTSSVLLYSSFLFFGFLPSFIIFRELASLLTKYGKHEIFHLSAQPEVQKIRKWLLIQFALNVVNQILSLRPHSDISKDFSDIDSIIQSAAERVHHYSEWLLIPMSHSMPLIYLLLLHVTISLNKENVEMRAELDETV